MPRILVTGKDGQVGFELQRVLGELGTVIAVGRAECDLARPDAIRALIGKVNPDIVVNPAAYTAVDKAESDRDLAYAVNADAAQVLAHECARRDALLIHYSTDYVFDGKKDGPYSEDDATGPHSIYGKSKLAGEEAIRAVGGKHLILRTSWVFGVHGANFLKTILRLAAERDSLRIVADQFGAPTSARMIADATAAILRGLKDPVLQGAAPACGTYHLAAAGETSWHGYAEFVVRNARELGMVLALDPSAIAPIATADYPLPAPRPSNSLLNTSKLQSTFGVGLPDWKTGVTDVLNQLKSV